MSTRAAASPISVWRARLDRLLGVVRPGTPPSVRSTRSRSGVDRRDSESVTIAVGSQVRYARSEQDAETLKFSSGATGVAPLNLGAWFRHQLSPRSKCRILRPCSQGAFGTCHPPSSGPWRADEDLGKGRHWPASLLLDFLIPALRQECREAVDPRRTRSRVTAVGVRGTRLLQSS